MSLLFITTHPLQGTNLAKACVHVSNAGPLLTNKQKIFFMKQSNPSQKKGVDRNIASPAGLSLLHAYQKNVPVRESNVALIF